MERESTIFNNTKESDGEEEEEEEEEEGEFVFFYIADNYLDEIRESDSFDSFENYMKGRLSLFEHFQVDQVYKHGMLGFPLDWVFSLLPLSRQRLISCSEGNLRIWKLTDNQKDFVLSANHWTIPKSEEFGGQQRGRHVIRLNQDSFAISGLSSLRYFSSEKPHKRIGSFDFDRRAFIINILRVPDGIFVLEMSSMSIVDIERNEIMRTLSVMNKIKVGINSHCVASRLEPHCVFVSMISNEVKKIDTREDKISKEYVIHEFEEVSMSQVFSIQTFLANVNNSFREVLIAGTKTHVFFIDTSTTVKLFRITVLNEIWSSLVIHNLYLVLGDSVGDLMLYQLPQTIYKESKIKKLSHLEKVHQRGISDLKLLLDKDEEDEEEVEGESEKARDRKLSEGGGERLKGKVQIASCSFDSTVSVITVLNLKCLIHNEWEILDLKERTGFVYEECWETYEEAGSETLVKLQLFNKSFDDIPRFYFVL